MLDFFLEFLFVFPLVLTSLVQGKKYLGVSDTSWGFYSSLRLWRPFSMCLIYVQLGLLCPLPFWTEFSMLLCFVARTWFIFSRLLFWREFFSSLHFFSIIALSPWKLCGVFLRVLSSVEPAFFYLFILSYLENFFVIFVLKALWSIFVVLSVRKTGGSYRKSSTPGECYLVFCLSAYLWFITYWCT